MTRFYAHESSGIARHAARHGLYHNIRSGFSGQGPEQTCTILDVSRRGTGTTICAFYDGAVGPYISYIEKFRAEFDALVS